MLRKELLDAFRDRRMVMVAFVIMPLAVPLVLAGMSAVGARKQVEKLEATLELPVIGAEHAPNLSPGSASHNVRVDRAAGRSGRRRAPAGPRSGAAHRCRHSARTGAPAGRRGSK